MWNVLKRIYSIIATIIDATTQACGLCAIRCFRMWSMRDATFSHVVRTSTVSPQRRVPRPSALSQNLRRKFLPNIPDIVGDVSGWTIIVTGPTSGIGEAAARQLVAKGARGASAIVRAPETARARGNSREHVPSARSNDTMPGRGLVTQRATLLPPVILACRDVAKGTALEKKLRAEAAASGRPVPRTQVNTSGIVYHI